MKVWVVRDENGEILDLVGLQIYATKKEAMEAYFRFNRDEPQDGRGSYKEMELICKEENDTDPQPDPYGEGPH